MVAYGLVTLESLHCVKQVKVNNKNVKEYFTAFKQQLCAHSKGKGMNHEI